MSKIILYIAASLDGYIAGKDDDISWLEQYHAGGEDYGYPEFIENISAVIMGARSYRENLKYPERTLKDIKYYVLSHEPLPVLPETEVEFCNNDLKTLVTKIISESNKDIWLLGGGLTVASFLNAGLLDEIIHFVTPILLKEGIPLYPQLSESVKLTLVETTSYKSGIVKLRYLPGQIPA